MSFGAILKKSCAGANGFSTLVHIRIRQQESDVLATHTEGRQVTKKFFLLLEREIEPASNGMNEPRASVVTRVRILSHQDFVTRQPTESS